MPSEPPPPPPGTCPFCAIAASHPPYPPSSVSSGPAVESEAIPASQSSGNHQSQSHVILSTKHVLAFLDIMPLTRGHVLVIPRRHLRNLGDVGVREGKELGKWLPILSRVVVRTVLGTGTDERGQERGQWNVVQNNGLRASQTVPHAHFHIIPRPPLDSGDNPAKGGWIMFGRGQRDELDDDEAVELVRKLRLELAKEVARIKEEEGIDLDADAEEYPDNPQSRRLERL
ncbi:hypothetical protein VTO42DRAFT_4209 [Malbranchea cinnamomea]